jgi:hypothetical protein
VQEKLALKISYITDTKSASSYRVLMLLNISTKTTVIAIHSVIAAHKTTQRQKQHFAPRPTEIE